MARINLSDIVAGYLSAEKLNTILEAIETAFDRVVFRDGTVPNTMEADLDLGGHKLLNIGSDPNDEESVPTFGQVIDYVDGRASGIVSQRVETQTATAGQTEFTFTTLSYTTGSNNLAIYVDGVRVFTPTDYTEDSSVKITFISPRTLGQKVTAVTNDYLATSSLPYHEHTWLQILNAPVYTTRWPTWTEVSGKPATFPATAHNHTAAEITSGRLADARRGVYVQSTAPVLGAGDAGALWFW